MYCVYDDALLTSLITAEGNFTNPDTETDLNADDGVTSVKALWCAVAQSKLTAGISDVQTSIEIDNAYFRWTDEPVIKIGTELLRVTAGLSPASTTLTVVRGWNSTTPAAHNLGDRVYLAYNGESVSITCRDNEQVATGDESGWITFCLDSGGSPDGNYQATLALGNILYNASVALHRKLVVPALSDAQSKQDLIYDLANVKLIALDS